MRRITLPVQVVLCSVVLMGQTPHAGPIMSFAATTDNIAGAHDAVRIDLLRWSTDAERDQLMSAWTHPAPAPAPEGRGGRGGGLGGGRGGRGGGAPAPPMTPEASLAAALEKAPVTGYLWSSEVAGYALHYAVRSQESDGGERIILITDRRLGESNDAWKVVGTEAPSKYEFSVVELHLTAKGEGEGKISLTGKIAVDGATRTIALENYPALPVILKNVRRRTS